MSAENMEVRWFRSKYSAVVHLYRGGRDQYGEQMLEYGGRTELLKDDITNGRVSLRIRNIRPFDDGQYTCYFQSSVSYEEALLELQVAEILRSEMESEKETLLSEREQEKETLRSELKRQKGEYEAVKGMCVFTSFNYALNWKRNTQSCVCKEMLV
ncbi:seizure 6-like protein 2 [Platysternon megacephalum]|uniref:Seizure 6-like protein 2 n=1 Tax=Platysternon megacephalum TaxID=55544 RepID=A0A4D9DTG4_9SAUR|nr:seizure 6-like protein 2 [Platysternon megacephalum]